ncbi:MAG: GNAT family N-acetyltransferase [Candidatus Thorarchaeota archaeon]|nr:GNAT family N-acetyltransferase [Candidatus Thorarchaeota archaeon]
MKYLSHDCPEAERFLKSISNHVDRLTREEIPFYIIVDEAWIRALVTIHIEPTFFFAPSGSTLGKIMLLNPDLAYLDDILDCAALLLQKEGLFYLVYPSVPVPDEFREVLNKFDYTIMDHSYSMSVEIEIPPKFPEGLIFKPMNPADTYDILRTHTEFYKGTGDLANPILTESLFTLSENELNSMFNEDTTFLATENGTIVGIVVISVDQGLLTSIAVSPERRGKGIARKILAFAVIRLKELGWGKIYLRVHAENLPAIKLYKSFGFIVKSETISYVYYPTCRLVE